jgi:hypothetical protein
VAWPIYPGVVGLYTVAMLGYAAALSGYRLPFTVALPVQAVLELLVVLLVWQTIKTMRKAHKAILRLFSAQTKMGYALLLQAFILLLPH